MESGTLGDRDAGREVICTTGRTTSRLVGVGIQIAASMAFKEGCARPESACSEPVMRVEGRSPRGVRGGRDEI